MQLLFVHGMGRSPVSGWPMLRQLKRRGIAVATFGYLTARADFDAIRRRLQARIVRLARRGDYAVVGHSLGGVLLRAALADLPPEVPLPKRLFLLATPVHASRLARKFQRRFAYRMLTGDCGQLLASDARMAALPPPRVPTTAIVGTRGLPWRPDPFGGEPNDGVVAVSETCADWLTDQVRIPAVHTLMPASRAVAEIILDRLALGPARA
jgi:pimeloyl-ACP methyl ester carboxylesterase